MRSIIIKLQKNEEIDNSLYEQLMKDVRKCQKKKEKRVYIPGVIFENIEQIISVPRNYRGMNRKISVLLQNMLSK